MSALGGFLRHLRELAVRMWAYRWDFVAFSVLFRLLESLLFAPLAGLAGQVLTGQRVVDSTALVSFALSPRGFAVLLLGAVSFLLIRLVEHAGLSVVAWGALEEKKVAPLAALRYIGARLITLIQICGQFVVFGLVVTAPVLLVAAFFAKPLLARHDINYYLAERPTEFMTAAVIIGIVAAVFGLVGLWGIVRWRWAVQASLFENATAPQAFRISAKVTRAVQPKMLAGTLASTLFSAALGLLASAIGSALTNVTLDRINFATLSLAIALPLLLAMRAIVGGVATLIGSCADAGYFTALYYETRGRDGAALTLRAPATGSSGKRLPAPVRIAAAVTVAIIVGFCVLGAVIAAQSVRAERPIAISAHRGSTEHSPENSLAAVREAIDDGADYVETDVQMTKDGALVMNHDSDFSRVAGIARKVSDLTLNEIRAMSLGGPGRGESIPTLDEFLAACHGHIKVNLELKFYGERPADMARKVVDSIARNNMQGQVLVQCLEYEPLLEVRALAPDIPIGYLMSVNARRPARLDVNFLSVEQKRVTRRFVMQAHRRGQDVHLWTVNKAEEMERAFDLGVDGIITDQSALAFQLRQEYLALTSPERIARRIKAWLA